MARRSNRHTIIAITVESAEMQDVTRRALKFDIDMTKYIYCGLCQESCPVDAIIEAPNLKFGAEIQEEIIYNKEKLLKNGELIL